MNSPYSKMSLIIEARVLNHNISSGADLLHDVEAIWGGALDTLLQGLTAPPLVLGLLGNRFP
jgi:hypothetical protein